MIVKAETFLSVFVTIAVIVISSTVIINAVILLMMTNGKFQKFDGISMYKTHLHEPVISKFAVALEKNHFRVIF